MGGLQVSQAGLIGKHHLFRNELECLLMFALIIISVLVFSKINNIGFGAR